MAWREFVIENATSVSGQVRRMDKSFIILYIGQHLKFRITARHHDGQFKYYLDCHQAEIYEKWLGNPVEVSKSGIKEIATSHIEASLRRSNIQAFVELNQIRSVKDTRARNMERSTTQKR